LPVGAKVPFTRAVPKPPAPPSQKGLDEVERAISVLDGRHPEHERTRRETVAAAEERRRALDKEAAAGSRRRRRRLIVLTANAVAIAAAGTVAWRLIVRTQSIRSSLEREEAPFVAAGLAEIDSNALSGRGTLETDVPGRSCFVAVGPGAAVRAREGAMILEAPGSVGWCACAPGRVALQTAGTGGLALLRIDASVIGGPLARGWVSFTPSAWGDTDMGCAEASLDDWIGERHAPKAPVDDGWLGASAARGQLKRSGFRVVGGVEPSRPFGLIESTPGDCMIAIAEKGEPLSLRVTGGARPIVGARGALAWCDAVAATTTVWRDGRGQVVVVAAPGARIGGLLGARECAESASVPVAREATWLREGDLAWDASALLRASLLSDVTTTELPSEPGDPDGRVAAIAQSATAKVEARPSDVVIACDPGRDASAPQRTAVCASAKPVSWFRRSDAPAVVARASLPVWLSLLSSHQEPDAVARIPEILALARRMGREGFEPTVFEGVVELPDGVRVVGRAGENAVVAIGLGPKAPWVFPFTDSVPWDLGDAPREVDLQPGTAVKLVSTPPPSSPIDKRRTIVFRRSALR
jgi:hypothetical protein